MGAWRLQSPGEAAPKPFYPLFIETDDPDPGGTLASEVQLSCSGRTDTPARAAVRVLASWSLSLGGIAGAELLLRFCEYLGAPRLQHALKSLLSGARPVTDEECDRLGFAIVAAAGTRFSTSQLGKLSQTLSQSGFYSPLVAAELIAARARGHLPTIHTLIAGSPLERTDGHGPVYRQWVGLLLEDYPVSELETAWSTIPHVKIRRSLLQAMNDLRPEGVPPPAAPPVDDTREPLAELVQPEPADVGWDLAA